MHARRLLLPLVLACYACSIEAAPQSSLLELAAEFQCVHQAAVLPPLNPDADKLFRYARRLERMRDPADYDEMVRYYRIAAAHDHYKANIRLQEQLWRYAARRDVSKESVGLAKRLVELGIPRGYFDIGFYMQQGYGMKEDEEAAWRYTRKAADLGDPDAQLLVGSIIVAHLGGDSINVARQMLLCASDQGHGKGWGLRLLGIEFMQRKQYPEALEAFQKGAAAGDALAAHHLNQAFYGPPSMDEEMDLGVAPDSERAERYGRILELFQGYEWGLPKVPDIDKIVPLPPVKLPPWDGTFEWEKAHEAERASPPPKPSDELIARLCKEKNLDRATGLPIRKSPRKPLGTKRRPANDALRAASGA